MKKIFMAVLMFSTFASPLLFLETSKPPNESGFIEPIDINGTYGGLESIEYRRKLPEFVNAYEYLEEIEKRDQSIALESKTQNHSEIRYDFDILKEDDFIAEPSFYGYSYELTDEERTLIERTVMHEAGWCSDYRILILTAQCFRNGCELNDWRPFEAFDKFGYAAMSYANPRAVKAVHEVFDLGVQCVPQKIFCYYNRTMVYSEYHESNNLAIDIDGNRFFY